MDDFVLNVRQIGQYPLVTSVGAADVLLIQQNGLGGAAGQYGSIKPLDLLTSTFLQAASIRLAPTTTLAWNGATLGFNPTTGFQFSTRVNAPILNGDQVLVGGLPVATMKLLQDSLDAIIANTVLSFNGRHGNVQLLDTDILRAGGVLATNPHFNGTVTAPTIWNPEDCTDAVATTAFVQSAICHTLESGHVVLTYNGRGGRVVPIADDVTKALTVFGEWGLANTPPSGDVSKRIANTAFVDDALMVLREEVENDFAIIADQLDQKYAPLDSAQLVGIPTAPTAAQTTNSGQLATTAFVHAAVTASTTGVSSFNTRTGAVVLATQDLIDAGGAPLNSPPFTGLPTVPLRALHDNTTAIASTAFVAAEIAALNLGVSSFNTRTGAVVLTAADVLGVGAAPLASPNFSGSPTAPTPTPGNNTTALATTAFVMQALSTIAPSVTSFNGRTGAVNFQASDISAVNGALLASPSFTGTPTVPTATAGTSNTQAASTAFVMNALTGAVSGVSTWNGRSGAVTLTAADLTAVGGALLAGPTFTGVPAGPTAGVGTNTTQLATTAFVQSALAAAPGGVSSFNGRTGAITFLAADVSAVGGALLSSPAFSGTPTAPTQAPGTSNTQLATTAFVQTAIAAGGGVTSFNGRAGVITLLAADLVSATGAIYRQSDTAPAQVNNTLWFNSLNGQLYVRYVDPVDSSLSWVIANSTVPAPTPAGARVLISSNVITSPTAAINFFYGFSATYDVYEIEFYGVQMSVADAWVMFRVSVDGATWLSGGVDYSNTFVQGQTAGAQGGSSNSSYIQLTPSIYANAAYSGQGFAKLYNAASSVLFKWLLLSLGGASSVSSSVQQISGTILNQSPLRGLQFSASSGTITAGTFKVYGIAK